jgi:hypothetical protein
MATMRAMRWWLIALAFWIACGGPQHTTASRPSSGWYIVQFTGARLDARRADGSPWHTSPGDSTALIIGGLIGLAAGNPALGLTLGEAVADPGGDPLAPAPFIDLKIEGETYRVSPVGRTYAPNWKQPVAIDARGRRGDEPVIVQIRDAVNDSTIAQFEMPLAQLLAQPAQTFTGLGAVMSLDMTVAPTVRQRSEYRVTVPATIELEDLARTGAPGWRPIQVWNGDTIAVEARGSVCPSSRSECFGPDGAEPGRWESYSYLKNAPHASLVAAAVPGEAYPIGVRRVFRVTQSGSVLLFVNDNDVDNNSGAFEARVTVTPPE